MADPTPAERLAALRQRWERDPKSRVFLQLAEEYRRAGRLSEAVRILESGLAHHPTYVAAQVVMGRCLLETGDMPRAVTVFERAIALDPTQIVANRLLVDAYLGVENVEKARQRLDLFRVLNDRDADIGPLEARIAAAGGTARPVLSRGRPENAHRSSGERRLPPVSAFVAPSVPPPASMPARLEPPPARLEPMPAPVSSPPESWERRPSSTSGRGRTETPFGDLHRPSDARRIVAAIAAGGVFPVAAPRVAPPTAPRRVASPIAPTPEVVPPSERPVETPFEPYYEPPPLSAPPSSEAEASPAAAWQEIESPDEVRPIEPMEAVPEPPPAALAPETAPAPTTLPPATPPASATLGGLYLAQGHLDDAEESFEAVLAVRPGDAEARAGLAEVRRRKTEAAAAFSEEMPAAEPDSAAVVGGLTAKKIDLLRQFMMRMRRGSQPHVS